MLEGEKKATNEEKYVRQAQSISTVKKREVKAEGARLRRKATGGTDSSGSSSSR